MRYTSRIRFLIWLPVNDPQRKVAMLPGTWAAAQMHHALIDGDEIHRRGLVPLINIMRNFGISGHPNPAWEQIRDGIVRTSAYRRREAR